MPRANFDLDHLLAGFALDFEAFELELYFLLDCLILGVIDIQIGYTSTMLILVLPDVYMSSCLSVWPRGSLSVLAAKTCQEPVSVDYLCRDGGAHTVA